MEQVIIQKKRSLFLDLMKGITIILVVLGHAIQFGSGAYFLKNNLFYDNIVFKIIYSFHMPLFMIISGYLFYTTRNKYSIKKLLLNRITKLLVPVFAWNALFLLIHFLLSYFHHNIILHEVVKINFISGVLYYICSSFQTIWFLWAIFWCSLVVILSNKLFKDNLFVYIIFFIINFIIPDSYNLDVYKFMYPFFIIGYFYNKYKESVNGYFLRLKDVNVLLIMGFIYFFLILFYKKNSYIYMSGYSIIDKNAVSQIAIDLYRLVVGLAGSIFILLVVNYIFKFSIFFKGNYITKLGVDSLGIYIVSGYLFVFVQKFTINLQISFLLISVETIMVLIISYSIIYILKKNIVTELLLFGGRRL